ncbi:MAG TPA: dihydroorotase [Caldimonas sp.]|jgi:dihydroorotase
MSERILISNARLVDPASGRDEAGTIGIDGERIAVVASGAKDGRLRDFSAARTIDARGAVVIPGLVDLAARLGEPGHEHAGLLESELAAAVAGGVTSLVCPPDTDPVLDEPGLVEMLKFRARSLNLARLYPLGALTRGLAGEALTEMAELTEAGCIGFGQADVAIRDTLVLHRALQYAATFGYSVWLRPNDAWLGNGVAAKGPLATRLGLSGVPVLAETIALATIFELMRDTGARVHLCRLSSAAGIALVRQAKAERLPVTCDVSIHQLHLIDVDIGYFDSAMRLVPPLRQQRDRDAIRAALADGTIDALVSDHTPVGEDAKHLPFAEADPGATGLELLLGSALKWGASAGLDLGGTLAAVTSRPAALLGAHMPRAPEGAVGLHEGALADLCLFAPDESWTVNAETLRSRSHHTPFARHEMPGRVRCTLVAGAVAYESGD